MRPPRWRKSFAKRSFAGATEVQAVERITTANCTMTLREDTETKVSASRRRRVHACCSTPDAGVVKQRPFSTLLCGFIDSYSKRSASSFNGRPLQLSDGVTNERVQGKCLRLVNLRSAR